jgi:hypothetical protein
MFRKQTLGSNLTKYRVIYQELTFTIPRESICVLLKVSCNEWISSLVGLKHRRDPAVCLAPGRRVLRCYKAHWSGFDLVPIVRSRAKHFPRAPAHFAHQTPPIRGMMCTKFAEEAKGRLAALRSVLRQSRLTGPPHSHRCAPPIAPLGNSGRGCGKVCLGSTVLVIRYRSSLCR